MQLERARRVAERAAVIDAEPRGEAGVDGDEGGVVEADPRAERLGARPGGDMRRTVP